MTRPTANDPGNTAAFFFAEPLSAERYERLRTLLPGEAAAQLPQFMAGSGNPDQAVLQMERLLLQHPSESRAAFEVSSLALRSCVLLFGCSQWLGQTLLQNPDLLQLFARPLGLAAERSMDDFREQFARFRLRSHETVLPALLARFKRREYVRIYARELLGMASLAEITREISALADVLIEQALAHCENELRRRHQGWPQLRSAQGRVYPARFAVLSLGKLGGNELNYSSDIDLLYLCDDAEDAGLGSISSREFFTRLAQELTSVLSSVSADGQVYRVDLRLRPQGASGEMVAGCTQALRYYRGVARDWELQALLKLRPSAGDRTLAREFANQAQELIYCEQISLSAIQTAARSLERLQQGAAQRSARQLDVKIGAGGLREIEFVVQCLQRVHGGREPWLRSSGTLFALQKLHDKGHIGDAEFRELCETYCLLRAIEHRLQCLQGVQTHRLPEGTKEQAALFRSLGDSAIGSVAELQRVMDSAGGLCARVLQLGFHEGAKEATALSVRLGSPGVERLMRELSSRSPVLAKAFAAGVGDPAFENLRRFIAAACTDEERIRATLENADWVERALPVFAQSALATGILARHPEDIVALFHEVEVNADRSVSDRLRIESRRCVLRTVGRSLLEGTAVWETLRTHSLSFDRVLQQALKAVDAPPGFAVLAVGRLGTCEMDVVSDADLVFLRGAECDSTDAEQCARSLVSTLSGYTREGSVVAVDTRVRPHGSAGELVVSSKQLAQYFDGEAKAWETLAFGKLRLIAGAASVAEDAAESLGRLRKRFAAASSLVAELAGVRKRLVDSAGAESFKTGPGGLYDLDFIAGLLEVRAGLSAAGRQLRKRLGALVEMGLLTETQEMQLQHAIDLFRRVDHALRVVEGHSRKWLPKSDVLRLCVERMVGVPELDRVLRAEMLAVRAVFDSIFRD